MILSGGYYTVWMLFKDIFHARSLYMETLFSPICFFLRLGCTLAYDCGLAGKILCF